MGKSNMQAAFNVLPDWIGVGLPVEAVALLSGLKRSSADAALRVMFKRGWLVREKPNEEWPYVYAKGPQWAAGRAALQQGAPDHG